MPPSADQILRNLKESPVPRMLPHWGLCYWVGVNEKVQNTGILCPIFLRCGLNCFLAFFFFQNSSPPIALTRALLFFWTLGWLRLALQLLCPAPPTWELYQRSKRTTRKCKIIVRNNAFESQGRGTLIFSLYVGLGPASTIHPKINIRNFKHPKKYSKF